MSRLPLRARVMVWFGLVSLLLTTALAVSTWLLTSGYIIAQRDRSAIGQANSNARRLPERFMRTVQGGTAGHQRTVLDGVPVLAVGLPLPDAAATYVEVSPLRELDRTYAGPGHGTVVGRTRTTLTSHAGRYLATSLRRCSMVGAATCRRPTPVRFGRDRNHSMEGRGGDAVWETGSMPTSVSPPGGVVFS